MEKVCGIDVHRDLLVATILNDQSSNVKDFTNDLDDINRLKDTIKHLDEKICGLDFRIVTLVNAKDDEKEMAIACSVPGVGP